MLLPAPAVLLHVATTSSHSSAVPLPHDSTAEGYFLCVPLPHLTTWLQDEVDSLAPSRVSLGGAENTSARTLLTELLLMMNQVVLPPCNPSVTLSSWFELLPQHFDYDHLKPLLPEGGFQVSLMESCPEVFFVL